MTQCCLNHDVGAEWRRRAGVLCDGTCAVRTGTVSKEPFCCSTSSFSLSIRSCFRASARSASSSRLHRSSPWN